MLNVSSPLGPRVFKYICTINQVDETLADIFDLNEYRMMANKRQIDALKSSLKAADQRISEAELINVNLETEVISSLVKLL